MDTEPKNFQRGDLVRAESLSAIAKTARLLTTFRIFFFARCHEGWQACQRFRSFHTAERTLEGTGALDIMRQGQVKRRIYYRPSYSWSNNERRYWNTILYIK